MSSDPAASGLVTQPRAKCVVSIDFGTYGSGCSFSFDSGHTTRVLRNWPNEPEGTQYAKTRTSLLYKGGELVSEGVPAKALWGWTAVARYQAMTVQERAGHQLLEGFKLVLQPPSYSAGATPGAAAPPVPPLPPRQNITQVIADFIKAMRKDVLPKLRQAAGSVNALVHDDSILWCLTVPAMWGEASKAAMRNAAVRAGMIPTAESDRLTIIIEPEAAALAAKADQAAALNPGDLFLVVDAGGGTTDITAHVVEQRGGNTGGAEEADTVLAEAMINTGDYCGSTAIDAGFEALYRETVGAEQYDAWARDHPDQRRLMLSKFEAAKRAFSGCSAPASSAASSSFVGGEESDDEEWFQARHEGVAWWRIPILPALHAAMTSENKGLLLVNGSSDTDVRITQAQMRELFDPVVDRVVELTVRQMEMLKTQGTPANKVLGVGGLMRSPYMQRRLREAVAEDAAAGGVSCSVHIPPNPEEEVMKGAVLYGCRPDLIHARRSRYSYGMRIAAPFDDDAPRQGKFWHDEEACYFTDRLFSPFVLKGQLVGCNEVVDHVFRPLYAAQETVNIQLFLSEDVDAKYVTEATDDDGSEQPPPMRALGVLVLDLGRRSMPVGPSSSSSPPPADDRLIRVIFRFGKTELEVSAEDVATQQPVKTKIRFAHTSGM